MSRMLLVSTTILVLSASSTTGFQPLLPTSVATGCQQQWQRPSFVTTPFSPHRQRKQQQQRYMSSSSSSSSSDSSSPSFEDLLQNEVLLGEGKAVSQQVQNMMRSSNDQGVSRRRRQVTVVPDEWPEQMRTHTVSASSTTIPPLPGGVDEAVASSKGTDANDLSNNELATHLEDEEDVASLLDEAGESTGTESARYSASLERAIRNKQIQKGQLAKPSLNDRVGNALKDASFGDYFLIVGVPVAGGYFATNYLYRRASSNISGKVDDLLESYANEMVFHSRDFDEMKLCHKDYSKKLVFMGPNKSDSMLKRYLDAFAKKKAVSPSSIRSLSEVLFNIYNLSEERAVKAIVDLCLSEPDKVASASKFLLLGNSIFSSEEIRAQLEPLRNLLAQSYVGGDFEGLDTMELVDRSQRYMMEAAYRATVVAAGKDQTSLTPGWDLLGLDEETAVSIFQDAAEGGFLSETEARNKSKQEIEEKYGLDKPKKKEGEEDEEDNDDEPASTSNAYSCSNCGFTLFVAPGRESVMFGPSFTCPECGASKDQFKSLDETE